MLHADLDRARALRDGEPFGDHERIWAAHQTISDPTRPCTHAEAAKVLRREHVSVAKPVPESQVRMLIALRCSGDGFVVEMALIRILSRAGLR